jgi:hypothetical protein
MMSARTGRISAAAAAAVVVIAEAIVFVALVTLPGQGGALATRAGSIERVVDGPVSYATSILAGPAIAHAIA